MAVLLCGCNSTPATVGTAVMQQPAAKCHVSAVPFSVTLSANDIDGKQTKLACYGQDGVGCKLRIYQIMVESFHHLKVIPMHGDRPNITAISKVLQKNSTI